MTASRSAIAGVYSICGGDAFRRREALEQLCARIAAADGDGQGPSVFEGEKAELAAVLDEVRTFSLLGGRRVVVVQDADEFVSLHREALERFCEHPVDSGTLILVCGSAPGNQKIHKIIAKQGEVIRFEAMKATDLVAWMVSRAQAQYSKKMDTRCGWRLRELYGSDLGVLDSEIAKLALFARERAAITVQDIDALVGRPADEDVFAVMDAIAEGDSARAMAHWEQVLATDRAAPLRAVGGLAYAVRKLLDMKQQADKGASMFALSKQAFCKPEVLEKRLRGCSVRVLQEQLCDLMETDAAIKTGLSTTASVAIERFIIKHSMRPQPMRRRA